MVSSVHLPQSVSEIENVISDGGSFVIFGFNPIINDFLHNDLGVEFNCGLHVSKAILIGALDAVKNRVLEWALGLEKQGVLGEGLSFSKGDKVKAQTVTNNIYGGNIGVLGPVSGGASNSEFFSAGKNLNVSFLKDLAVKIRTAAAGLPPDAREKLESPLAQFEAEVAATQPNANKIKAALTSMRSALEGAAGDLAAEGILAAIASTLG